MNAATSSLIVAVLLVYIVESNEQSKKAQGWQPHCPTSCICQYTNVYCDAMGLRRIPRPFPENTEALYLRDNFIRRVTFKRLNGLYNLKHLLMKGNYIIGIQSHAFKHLIKLISLSLTDNLLSYVSPKVFTNQVNLQVLSLRNNKIKHVKGLFDSLPKLQLLNMANNQIKYINSDTFDNNPQLRILDLHENHIKHIPRDAFSHLKNLRFLILRDNPIGLIRFHFKSNLHLELLDLTNCDLKTMPAGLPNSVNDLRLSENSISEIGENAFNTTRQIRLLVLNNNKIKKIHSKALSNLEQLYDLYIGKNHLKEIPMGLPSNIHGIYANYNNITSISEGAFSYHSKLEFLFLRNNNLKQLDQTALHGVHNLRSLDLSRNQIKGVKPYSFSKLKVLELLDLSKNPIVYLDYGCFNGLHKLTILQLSSVAIKSLVMPSMFKDMANLRFLDLSNSASLVKKMSANKMMYKSFKSVEDLNMMNDMLHTLPPEFSKSFPKLTYLKLIGNPWHCDENIIWLTDWMRNNTVTFYAPNFMTCKSPSVLRGKRLYSIRRADIIKAQKKYQYNGKPAKRIATNKHSIFKNYQEKQQDYKQNKKQRQYLSNSLLAVNTNTNDTEILTTESLTNFQTTSMSSNIQELKHIKILITPVKYEESENDTEDVNNEITNINPFKADFPNNNKKFDGENDNVNHSEKKFNVISSVPDKSSNLTEEQDEEFQRESTTPMMKADLPITQTTQSPVAEKSKEPLALYKYKYIQDKSGSSTERKVYNDRVFETAGQQDIALLQKYASAMKVRHSDVVKTRLAEEDARASEVEIKLEPSSKESSGDPH